MPSKLNHRILIIDNYDSYTFNLYQYCASLSDQLPVVIRNDQFEWDEFSTTILNHFDSIIIGPGPGRPDSEEDFGICKNILLQKHIPILGVCLGHQGLVFVNGGKIVNGNPPVHGRLSDVNHHAEGIFEGVPSPFKAVRYHSLKVDKHSLPECLEQIAWSRNSVDGSDIIMGLKHKDAPIWTVQFHPESICTEYGPAIIENFVRLAMDYQSQSPISVGKLPDNLLDITRIPEPLSTKKVSQDYRVLVKPLLDVFVDPEVVYKHLFSDKHVSFWLDSAKIEAGRSRYSYMGDACGSNSFHIQYSTKSKIITKRSSHEEIVQQIKLEQNGTLFRWVSDFMQSINVSSSNVEFCTGGNADFPFKGGLVGYFGYEMKAESLRIHESGIRNMQTSSFQTTSAEETPDAAFIFANRVVIYDHFLKQMYLSVLYQETDKEEQMEWSESVFKTIRALTEIELDENIAVAQSAAKIDPNWMQLSHNREQYLRNIETALDKINQGETYEVCLTTRLTKSIGSSHAHPFEFYQTLRRSNPAPYGGFMSFGKGLFLASSSPERFLQCDDENWIWMKPIKGTVSVATEANFGGPTENLKQENERRCHLLATNEKDRSENLMIVDLIRNDLNQISEPGTVQVPHLMAVESYTTVHQLVTTVKGKLRNGLTAVDAVMRSFPPGSMTGAPKLRTVHILEQLEGIPRGLYSGAMGFFSATGTADFNVVIRSAVFRNTDNGDTIVTIGAGGAIVALSDPQNEFDEMMLKANSVMPSLVTCFSETSSN